MLKTTKRYVLNTNAVNNYGFRLLSEGIDMSNYLNNPLMLWMHYRPTGASKHEVLALGNVKEIEIDKDGVMTGQPYFDDTDDFAKSIYNKYENGTYNMFSTCALPVEVSAEPEDLVPGQTGPTFTKTLLKEFSATDIGGNPDAYGIELCDESGKLIRLSEGNYNTFQNILKFKNSDMKLLNIGVGELLPLIKLADTATEAEAISKLKELIQLADANNQELVQLRDTKTTLTTDLATAKTNLENAEKANKEIKLADLKEIAVLQRKVTVAEFDQLVELSDGNYDKIKKVIDAKVTNPSIRESLSTKTTAKAGELEGLLKLSYQELDKSGQLIKLKDLSPDDFKAKYKERYGKDYRGDH